MSNITDTSGQGSSHFESPLQTTRTDAYSSFLLSMVVMIGLAVMMLGALFVLKLPGWEPRQMILIEPLPEGTENPPGTERDLEPPSAEEVEELVEPTLEETLSSITDSISAALDVGAKASGKGDSRRSGPEGDADIIGRYERWELKFTARDLNSYAKQLDHFNIELGAIGGKPEVDYASNVGSTPKKRSASGDQEKRLYFMFRNEGVLLQYDRQLLKKAGVDVNNRTILKFLTPELENTLANLELDYAKKQGRSAPDPVQLAMQIAKTIFECQVVNGKGYQWTVTDQRYRKPKATSANFKPLPNSLVFELPSDPVANFIGW